MKARNPAFRSCKACPAHREWFSTVRTCPLGWAAAVVRVHTVHAYTPILAIVIRAVINVPLADAPLETWTKHKQSRVKWASQSLSKRIHLLCGFPHKPHFCLFFLKTCPVNLIPINLHIASWPETSLDAFACRSDYTVRAPLKTSSSHDKKNSWHSFCEPLRIVHVLCLCQGKITHALKIQLPNSSFGPP